jgi:hypothetical protein
VQTDTGTEETVWNSTMGIAIVDVMVGHTNGGQHLVNFQTKDSISFP